MITRKLLVFLALAFVSCTEGNSDKSPVNGSSPEKIAKNWTEQTRKYIVTTYALESSDNSDEVINSSMGGIGVDTEVPLKSDSITTAEYDLNGSDLAYIKKRRSNGVLCYDAITINGSLYGEAEWFCANGNYEKIGYYYNDTPCGKWRYYSCTTNSLDSIVDFGNEALLVNFKKETFLTEHLINLY
ncbi:MAG: hypothetical protein AB8B56_13135 [Crocinitomicaceae bacterium]